MSRSHVLRLVVLTVILCPVVAQAQSVAGLVNERLGWMQSVAAHKWLRGLPIEDPGREAKVVAGACGHALDHGMDPDSCSRFIRAQIEAAKRIQEYWFRRWASGPGPRSAPDLVTEVRPELLRLGRAMMRALTEERTPATRSEFLASLDVEGLDSASGEALYVSRANVSFFPDRLAQVLGSGVLRIGTTADYEPFSFRDPETGARRGIDIELGRDLAFALGVTPVFVDTTWPTLLDDLAAGRYDIAMSGVSDIPERRRFGYFSMSYHRGGKVPVVRCVDCARLGSLTRLDRPEVRVIVNPGGTNERFVDAHIRHARKVLYPDNRTIFEQLLEGRADVMFTDRIEARLQRARHPGLCIVGEAPLDIQVKAFLMPRDARLRDRVDIWLERVLAVGTVARIFAAYLPLPGAGPPESPDGSGGCWRGARDTG